jgi:hypothetical protein
MTYIAVWYWINVEATNNMIDAIKRALRLLFLDFLRLDRPKHTVYTIIIEAYIAFIIRPDSEKKEEL